MTLQHLRDGEIAYALGVVCESLPVAVEIRTPENVTDRTPHGQPPPSGLDAGGGWRRDTIGHDQLGPSGQSRYPANESGSIRIANSTADRTIGS